MAAKKRRKGKRKITTLIMLRREQKLFFKEGQKGNYKKADTHRKKVVKLLDKYHNQQKQ